MPTCAQILYHGIMVVTITTQIWWDTHEHLNMFRCSAHVSIVVASITMIEYIQLPVESTQTSIDLLFAWNYLWEKRTTFNQAKKMGFAILNIINKHMIWAKLWHIRFSWGSEAWIYCLLFLNWMALDAPANTNCIIQFPICCQCCSSFFKNKINYFFFYKTIHLSSFCLTFALNSLRMNMRQNLLDAHRKSVNFNRE